MGYIGLRQAIQHPAREAKLAGILALIGIVNIPIIHYSVEWWNTLHQGSTITKFDGSAIDSSMLYPLLINILAFDDIGKR